tara:strand:- start:4684 stop:5673 length:990 start_codon:yes stop_codon:yes gene_type:complete
MSNNGLLDSLWVEKYRPKVLKDVVLTEEQNEFFSKCLEKEEIPSLLFYGGPGSGKSTCARILYDTLIKDDMDGLTLNGSDQGRIADIRDLVIGFLKSPPYASRFKIVFIDEFDGSSIKAQEALRAIMEQYCENGRFIFTANNRSKISDAIFSRTQDFEFKRLKNDFVLKYICGILEKEKIDYDKESVKLIVDNLMPDVRKILNKVQKSVDSNNKLKKIDINEILTVEKKIISQVVELCDSIGHSSQDQKINQTMPQIQTLLSSQVQLDFLDIYQELFYFPKVPLWGKIVINKYTNQHQESAIPSINFMAMIYDMIRAGQDYHQMFGKKN